MADDMKTVNFAQFEKNFFQQLNELRLENLFCDVSFNVNDKIIPCHRIVLATASPYFKTMFNGNFKESNSDTITMNDVETEAFEEILNFMYTASIRFSPSNAFFILKASHLLQLEMIENECASYIVEKGEINYLVDTCVFANSIRQLDLFYSCMTTMVDQIGEYGKTDSFKSIPFDIIELIFGDHEVFSDVDEEVRLVLIMKWTKENKASRKDIQSLLNSASLKVTNYSYVNSSLLSEFLFTYDDKRIHNGIEASEESDLSLYNSRLKLYLNSIDVKTGQRGWSVLKMNDEMSKYAVSPFYPNNSSYKKVCKVESELYCFEYFRKENTNVLSCYDNDNNRIILPSPEHKFSQFEMFAMGISIYVMLKNPYFIVWVYDTKQNTWLNILKKNTHETIYCNVSACTLSDGVFYIIADEYKPAPNSKLTSSMKYIYSIACRSLVVKQIIELPYRVRENHFICVFDHKIAVSGTWYDGRVHNQFMIYDIGSEVKQWSKNVKFMKHDHLNFNLFHFNGFIYAVENGRPMILNEKYDLKSNEWIDLPALPKQLALANTNNIVATGEVFGVGIDGCRVC